VAFDTVQQARQSECAYVDIHCHNANGIQTLEVLSIDTLDFDPTTTNNRFYSLGLHPWYIDRQDIQTALKKIASCDGDSKLLAIGECGLDKTITTPLSLQTEVFNAQIKLAEQLGKPLIIHCVRAYNELIQLKKSGNSTEIGWIIHGFNANPALADQLIKHGFYLSFGAALLNPCSRAGQALLETPQNRLFLETDTAELAIDAIYAAAAKMLGVDVATLRQQILDNFKRVFLND